MTTQIRKSSRSVPGNIAEGWKKRIYPKSFVSKLVDAAGEAGETEVWLDVSIKAEYLNQDRYSYFMKGYTEVNKMLFSMINTPEKFCKMLED